MELSRELLFVFCGLVALGILLQWVASRLRLPAIVLLLVAGLVLGPLTGWMRPDELLGRDLLGAVVAISVAVVLFEGGLSLKLGEVRRIGRPLVRLVFGGLLVTFAGATLAARFVAGLSWPTAAVLGAILIVTGPTVVKPMLRHARLSRRPALLLKWESIVNDPVGALIAVVVLELAVARSESLGLGVLSGRLALLVLGSAAIGFAAGRGLGLAMDRGWIPEHLKSVTMLAGVLVVFASCEAMLHEAGLLSVTVMGVVLANVGSPSVESIRHFKEDIAILLVTLLFLVLSARLEASQLATLTGRGLLFIATVLFVVRPLCAWISLAGSGLPANEKLLISWIAPRGVVAAAMGAALAPILADHGWEDSSSLVPLLFGTILGSVVLQGTTLSPFARRLGLSAPSDTGLLVVGAADWAIDLARALRGAGVDVVLVDQNYRNTVRARMEGIEAIYGDVLDEDTLDELPTERLGAVLAATGDDHYNSLVGVALHKVLGRERVYQLTPVAGEERQRERAHGARVPWDARASFGRIASRYWTGARFKVTELTPDFQWDDFVLQHEGATVLFVLEEKSLRAVPPDAKVEPGARLVFQTEPRAAAAPRTA